jgi:hypothetical protein
MTYLTKEQERQQFLAEFLQRLREAPPGTRVYMRVGDVFSDADVVSVDELRGRGGPRRCRQRGASHVPVIRACTHKIPAVPTSASGG